MIMAASAERTRSRPTHVRRPTTTPGTYSVRAVASVDGDVEIELVCEPTGCPARRARNFPQAFSHLAAVEAAAPIVLAERLAEITG
jgi:hypothetical protein